MFLQNKIRNCLLIPLIGVIVFSCNSAETPKDKQIVSSPEQIDEHIGKNIEGALNYALVNNGNVGDSIRLKYWVMLNELYSNADYRPIWSKKEKWMPLGDTLYRYIENAELDGLFPQDYHFKNLRSLKTKLDTDSLSRMDAVLWTRADLMLTDAFVHIVKDLKQGRLQPDSISLNKDSSLSDHFFISIMNELLEKNQFSSLLRSLQPKYKGYWDLKNGLRSFIDSMDRRTYTYLNLPRKKNDAKDSLLFSKTLLKRLSESGVLDTGRLLPDSARIKSAILKIQKQKGLQPDGKVSAALVRTLNNNDAERFKRIAINLDRYKQMPVDMPVRYILVNLPAFSLRLIDADTVVLFSKIICGKPETRTPLLNSEISNMITYPTWTVPNSIIVKSYLPRLKVNPNYLSKLGLKLMNGKGETVNPAEINWSKYSKGIPYKVMQESGDDNALGVIKFNFNNPYAVYLHDTNQRYLFKNANRAFSHGCVRVQEWEKLAFYIARNDSINNAGKDLLRYNADSIFNWIKHKERHRIDIKTRIPLFIRYFSCEGKEGKILFFEDIYGEDKALRDKYFADKE